MDTKECSKCGEVKARELFARHSKYKDGLSCWCKSCQSEYRKSYNQRREVKAKERERTKWSNKTPEQMTGIRASSRKTARQRTLNGKGAASARKRQASKLERTPSWANDQLIAAYYKEAKRLEELTGIQFHVDHIIPLQGELVSGLHVETNLQLLPAQENMGKSNSFDPMTFCA